MSRILPKMTNIFGTNRTTLPGMTKRTRKEANRLTEFVTRIIAEKDLDSRQVAIKSKKGGSKITADYVEMILSGKATNLTLEKLEALSRGLGEPFENVLSAAVDVSFEGLNSPEEIREVFIKAALNKLYEKSRDKRTSEEARSMIAGLIEALSKRQKNGSDS